MKVSKIRSLFLNNFTLAFVISMPIIFYVSQVSQKYVVEIEGPINTDDYKSVFYDDLNGDGNSDKVYFGENQLGNVFCKIYDPAHRGQLNSSGQFINYSSSPFFADIDEDGIKEILFFTKKDSSNVFLNIANYVEGKVEEIEICKVGIPGKRDFGAGINGYIDLDKDGEKEIVFVVIAGFALQPRAIYSFNPITRELKRTPTIGSKIRSIFIDDIDGDNYKEIICGSYTSQNFDSTLHFPFDDNWSRLFVFDHNLQFKFPPLKFSNFRSEVRPFPVRKGDSTSIYAYIDYRGDTLKQNKHILINSIGKVVKSGNFVDGIPNISRWPSVFFIGKDLMTLDHEGILKRIDNDLHLSKVKKLEQYKNCTVLSRDLNGDGINELVLFNKETGEITICENNLKYPASFTLHGNTLYWLTPILQKGHQSKYLIRNSNGHFILNYTKNNIWQYRFLLFALIFGIVYFVLFIVSKMQAFKLQERLRSEKELRELQYRAITSQFSPHYTFNVLNTFSSQIYQKENPEMYNYFNKFIRQLRYLYDDKNAVTRTIKEELQFSCDYLDIQKMRFQEKFEYETHVDGEVDQSIRIPKMIMHIFVENAFKHGLRPVKKDGLISIDIKKEKHKIAISIIDNGIGRAAAKEFIRENQQYSSGRGLEMLNEFIAVYNKGNKANIEINIEDLFNDSIPTGTKVKILIRLP